MSAEIEKIHRPFIQWLDERQLTYVYHRPDKRSGIAKGHPDFTLLHMRKQVMIECKTPSGRLSPDQVKRIEHLRRNGNVVSIARNLSECIEAALDVLLDGKRATEPVQSAEWPFKREFADLKQAVNAVPANGSNGFYVGSWHGTTYVFARGQDGAYAKIREASAIDIANLPKVPA